MHKVWLYAPGENASKWDVCLSQNIMCIGWDEMGNLLEYASKKEMAARLQEIYDKPEASFKNDSLALWEFAHEMQAGDIVIVKKGQNQIIGRGIVEGDYAFDESFSDFKNVRKMQWTNAGEWENIGKNVQKTLTDITKYPDYVESLEKLFEDKSQKQYWWLVASPKIWSFSKAPVGKIQDYTLYNDSGNQRCAHLAVTQCEIALFLQVQGRGQRMLRREKAADFVQMILIALDRSRRIQFFQIDLRHPLQLSQHQLRGPAGGRIIPLGDPGANIRHGPFLQFRIDGHKRSAMVGCAGHIRMIIRHQMFLLVSGPVFPQQPNFQPLAANRHRRPFFLFFLFLHHFGADGRQRPHRHFVRQGRVVQDRQDDRRGQSSQLLLHPLEGLIIVLLILHQAAQPRRQLPRAQQLRN